MSEPAAKGWMDTPLVRAALLACLGLATSQFVACKLAGPAPAEYVLGRLPEPTAKSTPETGLPLVEVKRVQLPDYLDRTTILERRGNQLVPSSTSRWGERLSVGMTRSLTASLADRLPGMLVTATPPLRRPARQVLVDVVAFESRADGRAILVAHWTILDVVSRQILASQQTSLVEAIVGSGDEAIVRAMSRALEDLAGQVAAGVELTLKDTLNADNAGAANLP